jgi:hypothetical protein
MLCCYMNSAWFHQQERSAKSLQTRRSSKAQFGKEHSTRDVLRRVTTTRATIIRRQIAEVRDQKVDS